MSDPIQVLLLTGANNHDWARSAPYLERLLEESGQFAVTLTQEPSVALENGNSLRRYRLFVVDYNGPDWSAAARANLEAAVRGGTGLVLLHAANNAFKGWTEFEKMAGLLWREGAGHGEFHEFKVRLVDPNHPVTRDLPDFDQWDELYHRLAHLHGVRYQVLASAWSDPAKGGSGRNEPMLVALEYGRGRVYHDILGHVWPGDPNGAYKGATLVAFESAGFRETFVRGCRWAARDGEGA
jgi:type 1 glutamine amidotransferase